MHDVALSLLSDEIASSDLLTRLQHYADNPSVSCRYVGNVGRFEIWRNNAGLYGIWTVESAVTGTFDRCHATGIGSERKAIDEACRLHRVDWQKI
jgi:hypothetical protein